MSNELMSLKSDLEKALPKLAEVAPKHLKVERVVRIILSACSRNPKLLECTKESVLTFCMKCSETGLEPIGAGGAWPVPYTNRKNNTVEMQFIPDYRGLVNCAKRAGCITDSYAEVVKEADEFDYELGLNPTLTHKPAKVERGELINAYCIFTLPDGSKRFVVMDADEIHSIRKRSKAGDVGPWVSDESEMWKKTVVRRAMKPFAGMNAELDAAIDADNKVSGISFSKEPISMPKVKTINVIQHPPNETVAGETNASDQGAQPSQSLPFDRDKVIAEVTALIEKHKAKRVSADMAKAGIVQWENGDSWSDATDEQLKSLASLLKC